MKKTKIKTALAVKGVPLHKSDNRLIVFCGSYLVDMADPGYFFYEALQNSAIKRDRAVRVIDNLRQENAYAEICRGYDGEQIISELEDASIFITGKGETSKECICNILDKASFIPMIRAEDKNSDRYLEDLRNLPDVARKKYDCLLNPALLSRTERDVFAAIKEDNEDNKDIPLAIRHDPYLYKNHYTTIETLKKDTNLSDDVIYETVFSLYKKRCIALLDGEPKEKVRNKICVMKEVFY